jgi:phage terminase large subunit-like protein
VADRGTRPGLFAEAEPEQRDRFARTLDQNEKNEWEFDFPNTAHAGQLPPEGDWRCWLILAGRGFGKTRAGSEWVRAIAERDNAARIALLAASLGEGRAVMVEGESGILACCPPDRRPAFEPSLRRLRWPGGAEATLYSAAEPESLRGPQHSHACRAGTKGVLRQRKPRADRYPASPGCRRRRKRTSRSALARRLLDSGEPGQRRMGGT